MSSHQMEQQSRKSVDSSPSASAHQPTVAESQISASHMSRERSTHTDYDDTNSSYMLSNRNNQSDASSQRKDSDDVGRINLGGRHFLSRWFFWPVFSLFNYSRKYNLTLGVLGLPADESATRVAKQLDPHFKREFTKENKEKGSVARALRRAFSKNYNRLFVWRIFAIAFTYLGAYYLLMNVLGFIEELEDKDTRENYINTHLYALALLFSICLASMCTHQLTAASTCVGIQVRSAIMVMIYRKALRLHSVELAIGDIVNLLADDVNRLAEAYVHKHYLLSSVLEGLVVLALAFVELKLSALPAVAILALLFPIQYKLGQYISHNAFAMAKRTADRVSAISEILTTLRVIKCYAWEIFFRDQVKGIRVEELGHLRRAMMAKGWTYAVTLIAPLLLTIVCLAVEQKVTGEVNMRTTHIFALLSIFNMFRIPLIMLPLAVHSHESAKMVHRRLDEFFSQPEANPPEVEPPPASDPKLRVYMNNADFIWEGEVNPAVSFISMEVRAGDVVGIVGDAGAGKTSLLAAIMGQLRHSAGEVRVHGSIAYVPAEPWLVNTTLKENIIFGMPYNERKYRAVIRACRLAPDISTFPHGDETEIGDRGANLTLPQRHRVSIARAAYSDASIILLDDPLSTMDGHIAKRIFNECISGYLRDKAIIMVTSQLHFLEHCNQVIVLSDGKCIEQGSYSELMAKNFNLANLVGDSIEIEDPYLVDDLVDVVAQDQPTNDQDISQNATQDGTQTPASQSDGSNQPQANTGPAITFAPVEHPGRSNDYSMSNGAGDNAARVSGNPRNYSSANPQSPLNDGNMHTFHGQMTLMGGTILGTIGHNNTWARALERNQLTIHSIHDLQGDDSDIFGRDSSNGSSWKAYRMFANRTTGIPISLAICVFFVVVQGLRIFSDFWLMHFAAEVAEIDEELEEERADTSDHYLSVYGITTAVYALGAFVATHFLYWALIRKSRSFHKTIFIRILRVPMSYFEYTPIGRVLSSFARHQFTVDVILSDALLQTLVFAPLVVSVIIAVIIVMPYSAIVAFILCSVILLFNSIAFNVERQLRRIEAESKPPIFAHLSATLEGLASIHVYHAESRFDAANIEKIDANTKALYAITQVKGWLSLYVGLASALFVYATALFVVVFRKDLDEGPAGFALTNAMQLVVFAQWAITSMREVHESIGSVEELVRFGRKLPSEAPVTIKDNMPPPDWPQHGKIEFENVSLRYHQFGAPAVKNASFVIHPRERIGIVGRTGSGKSTLVISLLRLIEADQGVIRIDGIDISKIGLRDLRSKIAVLPQEPTLFEGTVRSNLDPFNQASDSEIWGALRAVHLAEKIRSMPLRLDAPIIENGKGFSLGQRQLFCLARAILAKCRILLMDEATSILDLQTEIAINEVIRKNFADHTILQIGHRLNTIIDADKIMVMDQGRIVEFDTPRRLLQNRDGFFYSMVLRSGEEAARKLREKVFANSTLDHQPSRSILAPTHESISNLADDAALLIGQSSEVAHSSTTSLNGHPSRSTTPRQDTTATPPDSSHTAATLVSRVIVQETHESTTSAVPESLMVFNPPTEQELAMHSSTNAGEAITVNVSSTLLHSRDDARRRRDDDDDDDDDDDSSTSDD